MSIQAVAWVLEHSRSGGNDRLVLIGLANEADSDGWAAATKAQLARMSRLSVSTIWRALDRLVVLGEIVEVSAADAAGHGPGWWGSIRPDRRPRLFRFVGLTGSRGDTPYGVAGSRRGRDGVAPRRDASLIPSPLETSLSSSAAFTRVVDKLVEERMSGKKVGNRVAYRAKVLAELESEHDRIRWLLEQYPDAPVDVVAAAVDGDRHSLRFYGRRVP